MICIKPGTLDICIAGYEAAVENKGFVWITDEQYQKLKTKECIWNEAGECVENEHYQEYLEELERQAQEKAEREAREAQEREERARREEEERQEYEAEEEKRQPLRAIEDEIAGLKEQLENTDYQAIKFAEGWISNEDYSSMRAQRQSWRDEINLLQEQYDQLYAELYPEEAVIEDDSEEELIDEVDNDDQGEDVEEQLAEEARA